MSQRRVTWKGLRLVACLTLPTVLGFGAARAIAEAATPSQVTLPTTTSLTVTLPVTTATVQTPTTVQLPTTAPPPTTAPVPTTAPLPTSVQPTTAGTVTQQPPSTPAVPVAPPSGTASPATSSPAGSAAATGSEGPGAQASPAAVAGVAAARQTTATGGPPSRGGVRIVKIGRRERRLAAIGFRLPRPARILAVFRGPAPRCEVAYTFRGRGRPGLNRVPASALVRKGIVETGVYAVRVVAVRGERRQRVGEIVVALRRLEVRRLSRERHRCRSSAARGFLAAVPPMLGAGTPSLADGEGRPGDRRRERPSRPSGVAAAPEIQLPLSPPAPAEPSVAPAVLFYGLIAIVLFALAGIGASVLRTLRSEGDTPTQLS